jgi:hypothetical protein
VGHDKTVPKVALALPLSKGVKEKRSATETFLRNLTTRRSRRMPDEYDSPWKEALDVYLRPVLEFCFPKVAAAIDWEVEPKFLDKELQEVTRDAALGEQRVDKLVQVQLRDGTQEWILVHIEVQHQRDVDLPWRVYQYYHRVRDRFGRRVVSLAILADEQPGWRPSYFEEELLGCRVRFEFPICKLLDLVEAAERASHTGQPSALIILANWATQRTRHDMPERRRWKSDLTRRLYGAGLGRNEILQLYCLLDWLMRLPEGLEREYKEELREFERSRAMPYITSIERMGREEGREEGREVGRIEALRENILEVIEARFGPAPAHVRDRINRAEDGNRLKGWLRSAATCATLGEFELIISV